MYDVIIVGAGPGGIFTAYELAEELMCQALSIARKVIDKILMEGGEVAWRE